MEVYQESVNQNNESEKKALDQTGLSDLQIKGFSKPS